jgi:signal transduction histidine kinase
MSPVIEEDTVETCRVLLLEDSLVDAELIGLHLSKSRYAIDLVHAVSRDDFLRLLRNETYDLILSDYSLPDFDGIAALAEVRALDPDTPFIFVSGVVGEEFAVESLRKGATDYVLKQRLIRLSGVVDRAVAEAKERRERRRAEEELQRSLKALRRNEEALQSLNETLERRVEARTQELAAVNRQLLDQIEERERVEATLRQMQRLEAIGQLTSGVAHDFNNLLTVILGNIDFIARGVQQDEKLTKRLAFMRIAAERGAALTSQLLAFSRRQKLEPKPVDLNRTVVGMAELIRSSMGGAVRLETVLKSDLWPALVDPNQIELVILNLAINARDAMGGGGDLSVELGNVSLTEEAQRPEAPAPGDYVMVRVSDTGSGMTDDVLAKAFEPFFTTKEVGKGSGLGLSQVLGFAKQSGGGVRIHSVLGQGTAVEVYLPRAVSAAEVPDDAISALVQPKGRDEPRQTVLVVDDDGAVREVTTAILESYGFEVIEAGNGPAALREIEARPQIDLLLLDVAMPGMTGIEVARAVRTRRPDLPVLFVTGYADRTVLHEVYDNDVIQKPFRGEDLVVKVRRTLAKR